MTRKGDDEAEAALLIAQRFLGSSMGAHFTAAAAGAERPHAIDLSEGGAAARARAAEAAAEEEGDDEGAPAGAEWTRGLLALEAAASERAVNEASLQRLAVESTVTRLDLHKDDPTERAALPSPPRKEMEGGSANAAWMQGPLSTATMQTTREKPSEPPKQHSTDEKAVRATAWEVDVSELRKPPPSPPQEEEKEAAREAPRTVGEARRRGRGEEGLRPRPTGEGRRSHSGWVAEFVM